MPRPPALPQIALPKFALPSLSLETGTDRWISLGGASLLVALLLLVPAASPELLLALGALGTIAMLQRRRRRFWSSVGWSLGLLVLGLVSGGLLSGALSPVLPLGLPLSPVQVQSLPALILLGLGALLIA